LSPDGATPSPEFQSVGNRKTSTPLGEFATIHISKAPPPDSKDQTLDIGSHRRWTGILYA
jgi:hypothetical protein